MRKILKENHIESLRYLDLESMRKVIGEGLNIEKNNFCVGCFTGDYERNYWINFS